MGDLNKHIYLKEKDPYGKIFISPLEKDKRQKEEFVSYSNGATQIQIFSSLLSYFQRLIRIVDPKSSCSTDFSALQKILTNIKGFRRLLATLAKEDSSHNPIFNQELSELWHNLLDDCNCLQTKDPFSALILVKLNFFIGQIKNFPIGSEYTLGYYFTEEIGKNWTPFPCMKLLQQLHEEFINTPSHSTLHNWILLLDEILILNLKKT